MQITVHCDCGKQLRVSEAHVGSRVRCPECGHALLVSDPDAATPPGMVPSNCGCGKRMQAKAEFAGKSVRCPECGASNTIPAGETRRDADEPAWMRGATTTSPRTDARAEERRSLDGDGRAAARKRGKSGRAGWIFAGLGVLLLAAVGLGYYLWTSKSEQASAAQLAADVPGDAAGFASVRVADLLATDAGRDILNALPPEALQNLTQLEQQYGLTLKDVDRVTVVLRSVPLVPGGDDVDGWLVYRLNRPADAKKIRAALGVHENAADHKGVAYYIGRGPALCFIDERTVLVGPEEALTRAINQSLQPRAEGPLADLVARAGARQVTAGFIPPAHLMALIPQNAGGMKLGALTETQQVFLAAGLRGRTADIEVVGIYASEAKAQEAKGLLDAVKAMANLMMPQPGLDPVGARNRKALDELNFVQKGTEVSFTSRGFFDVEEFKRNMQQRGFGQGW
jgi:DNA-directed RNA polymerase subunit RPC12/RpoP